MSSISKRLGLIARFDNAGLGTLSWEFARHLRPEKVLLVQNGVNQTFPERYADFPVQRAKVPMGVTTEEMEWLTTDVDTILSFETFYDWRIVLVARKKNVRTVLLTMYELHPEKVPYGPSLYLCPSKMDYEVNPEPKAYLPIPVATDRLIWREHKVADVFIHTASHGGIADRKGTGVLVEAMKYVRANIKLKIFTWHPFEVSDSRIDVVHVNFRNYWQPYREGDVLVYPQGANGICLPIVEAMCSGMGVITTDFYPFNEYMPKRLLFEPDGFRKIRFGGNLREVDDPIISPKKIAEKIDEIAYGDISKESLYGFEYAQENSWEKLLPRYLEVL